FYTYWFYEQTTGLSLLKKRHFPSLKLLTRAHGMDIYAENYDPPYIPFRELSFSGVQALFPISKSGQNYFTAHYPQWQSLYQNVEKLGVEDFGITAVPSSQAHLVSCSFLWPGKRIDLLIESLALYAKKYPHQKICWDHIGDGPLLTRLQKQAQDFLPPNVS